MEDATKAPSRHPETTTGYRDGFAPDGEVRLPRPPGSLRRRLAAHPRAVDIAIGTGYLLGCVAMAILDLAGVTPPPDGSVFADPGPATPTHLLWLGLALVRTGIVATALLLRRRYPLTGLIAVCLALFGDQGGQVVTNSVALLIMLYGVAVYRSVAAGWVGYAVALGCSLVQSLLHAGGGAWALSGVGTEFGDAGDLIFDNVMSAIWLLAILMVGINVGDRRRHLAAVVDRAHQLTREREHLAQLAVAEERSRIAREMHDIVAHSVSVMIALSEGAVRAAERAPEAATEAMQRSAETGHTALAEMRRLLGALHDPAETSAELAPQPGVDDLPALVRGFEDAGLDIELSVRGPAAGDRGQDLAVYRVVQEGLTNVLRHAGPGARADVTLERTPEGTDVTVRDHGPPTPGQRPVSGVGAGRGLQGVAERVRVFGGRFASGPAPDGGWRLHAAIPVRAAAREREQAGDGQEERDD